jgi:hypothetical protein
MAKPGYMHLGEVPEEVFQKELLDYLKRKEANPEAKRVKAQFNYKGKNYTFQRSAASSGYQIKRSSERVAKEAKRRGLYHDQAVPLGEIEQMMVDNYYEEAQKRGLQVDHKIPIARGGPSNAPWNLGLMTPKENAAKAERIGGSYVYEPFLKRSRGGVNINAILTKANMPALGGFQEDSPQPYSLPGGSDYKPPELEGMASDYVPMQPPLEPKQDLTQQIYETSKTAVGVAAGVGFGILQGVGGVIKFATGGGF